MCIFLMRVCCQLKQAIKDRNSDAALAYALLAKEIQLKVVAAAGCSCSS